LTPHEHVPLYRRGIALAAAHDPTTGLLVSMHGAGLYNDCYGTAEAFLAEMANTPVTTLECRASRASAMTAVGCP
jgi:hypothetical protein